MLLAQLYGFCLMAANGLLKPLRENLGVECGARNLEWLWLGTLAVTIAILPPYWRLTAGRSRRSVIAWVHRGVSLSLVAFFGWFALFRPDHLATAEQAAAGSFRLDAAALYVWISVFNLLLLSLFWSAMADRHDAAQGKRLFGRIAIGITVGAIAGSLVATWGADELKTDGLLLVAAALIEGATQLGRRLAGDDERATSGSGVAAGDASGGAVLRTAWSKWVAGFEGVARSPFLLGLIGYQFLSILASTLLYTQRTELMGASGLARDARTALFGWNDLATQTLALLLQGFVAARLLKRAGVGVTRSVQMVVVLLGFVALGFAVDSSAPLAAGSTWWSWLQMPAAPPNVALAAVLLLFVLQKGIEYGLSKPGRETLFTVVTRDEKYQAKSLIDTGLYRAFDQISVVGTTRLRSPDSGFGFALSTCAFVVAPVMALGVVLAFWLSRQHAKRAAAMAAAATPT